MASSTLLSLSLRSRSRSRFRSSCSFLSVSNLFRASARTRSSWCSDSRRYLGALGPSHSENLCCSCPYVEHCYLTAGQSRDNSSKGSGGPSLLIRCSASSAISLYFNFDCGSLLNLPPFLKKSSHCISVG